MEFNNPARYPAIASKSLSIDAGQVIALATVTTVPAGQRLVIDTISGDMRLPVGQRAINLLVWVDNGGVVLAWLPLTLTGSNSLTSYFSAVVPVQLYADPGSVVGATAARNSASGHGLAEITISGHYVNV
jgi:hypothetical protein